MLSSICFMPASLTPQSLPPLVPSMASYFGGSIVVTCMRAGLYQTKKGLFGLLGVVAVEEVDDLGGDLLVHGSGAVQGQRAFVLARLVLFGAVGGVAPEDRARGRQASRRLGIHSAGNLGHTGDRRVLAWRRDHLLGRRTVDVGEAHALHCVQVVKVAPIFLEAVGRRQGRGMVAKMVLAELAGGVAEIAQELPRAPGCRVANRMGCREVAAGSCRCAADTCR